ncbi:DNA polymerase III subunit beta [uncultured Prevotella sp.]|uniref:DNA polymerase III subunit beta n=1 Tax=uncultured Prevotella sp. TaxID=159272 RepID=UPI002593BDAB|nr:DNA polymerase III subunit beta [uncultured Prevotella sp.]
MKLQAQSSKALHAALNKSAKCIGSKNTIAILDNVLLTRKGEQFFLTSSTTESQLTIPAPLTICNGTYDRDIVLPIKMLSALLSTLPDCVVTFDIPDDSQSFTVEYCTSSEDNVKPGKAQMCLFPGGDFPQMEQPKAEQSSVISLPMSLFHTVVDTADKFAVMDELRPQLSCLCIDVAEDRSEVVFVGTNGQTLVKMTHSNDPAKGGSDFFRGGQPGNILIHRNYFRTISAFDGSEDITIENDGHTIRFTSGETELICKQVEGRYPNYNAVIPKNNPFYVVFDKKEMLDILRRVSLFSSNASNLVEIQKNGMFLTVSANDADFSVSGEDQVCIADAQCDENFRIGLKSTAFQTCINSIPSDTIRMQLIDPTRAVVITADDPAPKVMTLCMPMILND